ncbi:hypothetical protein WME73_04205 [Sorangium sp. So ce302]|uniref:hypothetical protein n=1 Tax=Sorangium sp. So ce302 TaxID=3133297 RepID=UPI003F61129B
MLSVGQTNVPAAILAVKTESGIHAGQVGGSGGVIALASGQGRKKPKDESAVANRRDPWDPPGFRRGVATDRSPSEGVGPTRAQPASLGRGELATADPSPRAAVVAELAGILSRAVAFGDDEAARILYGALGRLLGLPAAPYPSGDLHPDAEQACRLESAVYER